MISATENAGAKSMKQLIREWRWMCQDDDFESEYEIRCCFECYHFAEFIGYDFPICERSHEQPADVFAYTDCDDFRLYDGIDGSIHRWPKKDEVTA